MLVSINRSSSTVDWRLERMAEHHSHALAFGRLEAVRLGSSRPALLYGSGRYAFCGCLDLLSDLV